MTVRDIVELFILFTIVEIVGTVIGNWIYPKRK